MSDTMPDEINGLVHCTCGNTIKVFDGNAATKIAPILPSLEKYVSISDSGLRSRDVAATLRDPEGKKIAERVLAGLVTAPSGHGYMNDSHAARNGDTVSIVKMAKQVISGEDVREACEILKTAIDRCTDRPWAETYRHDIYALIRAAQSANRDETSWRVKYDMLLQETEKRENMVEVVTAAKLQEITTAYLNANWKAFGGSLGLFEHLAQLYPLGLIIKPDAESEK